MANHDESSGSHRLEYQTGLLICWCPSCATRAAREQDFKRFRGVGVCLWGLFIIWRCSSGRINLTLISINLLIVEDNLSCQPLKSGLEATREARVLQSAPAVKKR
jgi:hypothetical protein